MEVNLDYSVNIIDGEVNLKMGNTSSWFVHARNDIEKFYVKVKTGNRYITDGKDAIHARFLQMKRDLVTPAFEVSTNNTPLKIGKADTNVKNYHPCKFEKIILTDGTDAPSTVFEEGKTSLKKETTSIRYEKQEVLFDFDKHLIRADAQAVLDELLQFLIKNEHLAITLSGHADDRGELDYNQRLSEKRADEVRLYLYKKGLDKTKFTIAGYGEARPKVYANTEASHQKNRRVVIEFSYVEYNAQVMVYETVAGSKQNKKNIKLKLEKLNNQQCFRDGKERHTKEIIVKENTNLGSKKETKTGDQIAYEVFSYIGADFRGNY
ncbi:hypothetical protein B0A58_02430 [Flavobacterium branchiophilum NBRC 15030 = ATCC 35035]|uniref:OmpA family protein n=1 Tax=Flavobacterium branchiophilum TaxID=55197 RepID=A0A543G250_9FLAO|nr:OmpA family protein [Flavobacterium branchiophilum]OXA80473.1 hypothetical protein B0A58_02430 [Flavobacterium branchiophilum NBRC 15030 = ATCC 35035]TQM40176.1 OmpA family protein [Flavobacterium branchiophilum]GEM56119.1 hypothetical protein FB1_23400 [Flavobacterium branchiophilum NBRC 15030 = ATCC 35035]